MAATWGTAREIALAASCSAESLTAQAEWLIANTKPNFEVTQ
jgi:hypothetical protein